MKYDPNLPFQLGFSVEETSAYQLLCHWMELTASILPDYVHSRIPRKGDIRNSILFKHMLKFYREKNLEFKGFQYILFMRAQLEIARKLQKEGKRILVDASLLHGEKAYARWSVWKRLIKENRQTQKATYAFVEQNVITEMELTKKTIGDLLENNFIFEKYLQEASNLLRFVILKKISPLYVVCSKWIEKLPDPIKNDITDLANIENLKDFDLKDIQNIYKKYFDYEYQ